MKPSVKPKIKVLHRQGTGYKGRTIREGARTTLYLPHNYMNKMRKYCQLQGVSVAEWTRTVICGVLDGPVVKKQMEDKG